MKTSLGTLSKNVVGIELDWRVTLVRVKSARVTAIWIGDRYMRWMKMFMTENNFIDCYTLHYQEKCLISYLILYACVDHGI